MTEFGSMYFIIWTASIVPVITTIGGSLALYFVVSCYFGFLLGLVANTALFIGILFLLRRKQIMEQRSLGSDEKAYSTGFNWFSDNSTKMRYIRISCGSEMKGIVECNKCGSKMKKPIFRYTLDKY